MVRLRRLALLMENMQRLRVVQMADIVFLGLAAVSFGVLALSVIICARV